MLLNKTYLLILLLLFCTVSQAQTIIPGGYVSGTWDSLGSPYIVQSSITIHGDSSLHILEGVTIAFNDSAYLEVQGYISAIGTMEDTIHFRSYETAWQGVRIVGNDSLYGDSIMFYYCSFSNANSSYSYSNGGALSFEDRDSVRIIHPSSKPSGASLLNMKHSFTASSIG